MCRTRCGEPSPPPPGELKSSICTNATPQARPLCLPVTSSGSSTRSRWSSQRSKRRQRVWSTDMRLKRRVSEGRTVWHVRPHAANCYMGRENDCIVFEDYKAWSRNHTNLAGRGVQIWAPVVSGRQSDRLHEPSGKRLKWQKENGGIRHVSGPVDQMLSQAQCTVESFTQPQTDKLSKQQHKAHNN